MAALGVWKYKERPESDPPEPVCLVQFSNGKPPTSQNVKFQLHKSTHEDNPRKRHHLVLAAETDGMTYVGNNFGPCALKCNSLCKYFVGVLNKTTGVMKVHDAQLFNMQPTFPDESLVEVDAGEQTTSYRDKVNSLIEAFGTIKQKRALSSRRSNEVGNDTLQKAVAKAAEHVIEKKGLTALSSEAAQFDSQGMSAFLPPCHADAEKPEDVYRFEDLFSDVEYQAMEALSEKLKTSTSEDIRKLEKSDNYSSFVVEALQSLPRDEENRDHVTRCLGYIQILIRLHNLKKQEIKYKGSLGSDVADVVNNKLMRNFTMLAYNNGRVKNMMPDTMKAKIAAYVIALALHINGFQTDLTHLQRNLKLSENRMLEIARALKLKLGKQKVDVPGVGVESHRIGTLSLPLPVPHLSHGLGKKRKIR